MSGATKIVSPRNAMIDYGRFVAALGIVWFHTQAPGMRLAYVALPFFLVLLTIPSRASTAKRAERLLLPFLRWSVLYAVVLTAMAIRHHEAPFGWWQPEMVLTGTAIHLWFLPFAFLIAVLSPLLRRPLVAIAAAIGFSVAVCLWGTPSAPPFAQWSFGLLPVLTGFVFFAAGWRVAVPVLAFCWLILSIWHPAPDNTTIVVGTALSIAALSVTLPANRISDWCSTLSLWIYLGHPLVIIAGQTAHLSGLMLGVFAIIGSIAFALAIETVDSIRRKPRGKDGLPRMAGP